MAPKQTKAGMRKSSRHGDPPRPFRRAPEDLAAFCCDLSPRHVYIAHIDEKPWKFKRKIFLVPVLMNVAVFLAFLWRLQYVGPWYIKLATSGLGHTNDTTINTAELSWNDLLWGILRRAFTFLLDFNLVVFVWPWPAEFCFGKMHGSPVKWRWRVGFRDKEIYVRRSRAWDTGLGDFLNDAERQNFLTNHVRLATSTTMLQDKTGYLTMNGEWDLDWAAMVHLTTLVDKKAVALDLFRSALVLVYHDLYGWLSLDLAAGPDGAQEERRRQVFLFRDALTAVGKENLFFRWIEVVQFEATQPGGLSPEKQEALAARIRELFVAEGIDFDQFWKDSVETKVTTPT